uniref:Uncharacterized protein n=1 Tax=Opuntia streptacantha TaxID=393608 RepID=A0A7C8ZX55_OPUST
MLLGSSIGLGREPTSRQPRLQPSCPRRNQMQLQPCSIACSESLLTTQFFPARFEPFLMMERLRGCMGLPQSAGSSPSLKILVPWSSFVRTRCTQMPGIT